MNMAIIIQQDATV